MVNQVLEDILRIYVTDKLTKWEYYFPLVEFVYNNDQQPTNGMSPFETLYGQKCKTFIHWDNLVNRIIIEPSMLGEMEK